MKHNLMYVANWKMAMPSLEHAKLFGHELAQESKELRDSIVICPSTIHLFPLMHHFREYDFTFAAQNCSQHLQGAYTGQTSVLSLQELKVRYCIVGHSEQRRYQHETNEQIAQKVALLYQHGIAPIICIGETQEERDTQKTFAVLEQQLNVVRNLSTLKTSVQKLYIAYEPVWAIGTGKNADAQTIQDVLSWISQYCKEHLPNTFQLVMLYGGSVDLQSAPSLKEIEHLGGFLIGSASLDFQKFKKIVI